MITRYGKRYIFFPIGILNAITKKIGYHLYEAITVAGHQKISLAFHYDIIRGLQYFHSFYRLTNHFPKVEGGNVQLKYAGVHFRSFI